MEVTDLAKPFAQDAVHWRVQGKPYERNGTHSAMALAYIDARDVMDRLDEVCGPAGWQDKYEVTSNGLIICSIGVHIYNGTTEQNWVWKSDGAGETAVEGKKGGMSDALKRAAVKWGIGRYLYRLDSPWVKCVVRDNRGTPAWKKWAEDPWSKVKTTTYHAAETSQAEAARNAANSDAKSPAEKQEPKAVERDPRDPRKVADTMIGVMKNTKNYGNWNGITTDPKWSTDVDWLRSKEPAMVGEVLKAVGDAKARVDPASQGPDERGEAA